MRRDVPIKIGPVAAAVAVVFFGASDGFTQSDLESAYEKEFAHLEAQKRSLQKRLEKLEQRQNDAVREAEQERDALQGELTRLREQADQLKRKLEEVETEAKSEGSGRDVLRTTLEQAESTLEPYDVSFAAPGEDTDPTYRELLPEVFGQGAEAIAESRSLRSEEGSFFLPDGSETSGTVYRIGGVASYGISDEAAGTLAPAGNGRLKLMEEKNGGRKTAEALAVGELPGTLGIFLYESTEDNVEPSEEKTWLGTINSGGAIAWVIVGMAAIGLLLVLLRCAILVLAGFRARRTIRSICGLVEEGERERAAAACKQQSGPAARVLGTVLENLDREREEIEDVVSEAMLRETPRLERFSSAILVFAAVAPLLGLLGTVTGMISTFDVITKFGTGDPRMLSGGISEALVTTQLGLIVAIPLLLIGNLLKGWAEGILTRLERGALRIINVLEVGRNPARTGKATDAAPAEDRDCSDVPGADRDGNGIAEYLGAV